MDTRSIVIIILVTVICHGTAGKIPRSNLEEYLTQCWKEFVDSMSTGIPDLNIPTFDPWFSNDNFPFRMQDSDIALRADVNATSIESLGFSSVQIPGFEDTGNSLYNVSLALSDLRISGFYSIVGSHHYFYPIVGNGPFELLLRDVWSTGTTTLQFDGSTQVYSLTTIELKPLLYGSAAKEFFGLSISGTDVYPRVSDDIYNMLTQQLWSQVEEELRLQLSVSVTEYLNDQLLDFPPSSFLQQRKPSTVDP